MVQFSLEARNSEFFKGNHYKSVMVGNLNTWRSHWCWCHSLKIDWEPCIRDLKCATSLQLGQGSRISVWFLDLNIRICDSEHFHISSFKFSQFLNYFANIHCIWDESALWAGILFLLSVLMSFHYNSRELSIFCIKPGNPLKPPVGQDNTVLGKLSY